MIKVEKIGVYNIEGAVRGIRNALASWSKSDSYNALDAFDEQSFEDSIKDGVINSICKYADKDKQQSANNLIFENYFVIGDNDMDLMRKLYRAGDPSHRKYLRQIFVSMDIIAPMYWFSEFDTYKVGTVANSTSKMHTIHKTGIDYSLFSFDGGVIDTLDEHQYEVVDRYMHVLEDLRKNCKSGDKTWRTLIQLLPESFNQKRTVTMNYENVVTMIKQRTGHKLNEWNMFVDILKSLPYVQEIIS